MTINNVKRNLISDEVLIIKARRNNVCMGRLISYTDNFKYSMYTLEDVKSATTATAFLLSSQISDMMKNGFEGQLGIVAPDDLTLKAFIIQRYVNRDNVDGAREYFYNDKFSWMTNEWHSAMENLIDVIAEAKAAKVKLVFVKESEIFQWELKGETDKLKNGQEITLIAKKDEDGNWTSSDEEGLIFCSGNRVEGKFKVQQIINKKGISTWRIDRELNPENELDCHIENIRHFHKYLVSKLPGMPKFDPKKVKQVDDLAA